MHTLCSLKILEIFHSNWKIIPLQKKTRNIQQQQQIHRPHLESNKIRCSPFRRIWKIASFCHQHTTDDFPSHITNNNQHRVGKNLLPLIFSAVFMGLLAKRTRTTKVTQKQNWSGFFFVFVFFVCTYHIWNHHLWV